MTTDIAAQRDALSAEVAAEEARIAAMVQSGAPHCLIQRVRAYASDLRIREAGLALMLEILAERAASPSPLRRHRAPLDKPSGHPSQVGETAATQPACTQGPIAPARCARRESARFNA
jgi:hypothetical protein